MVPLFFKKHSGKGFTVFLCSVHSLTSIHSLPENSAAHENRCSHNYTRIWYPSTLSFFFLVPHLSVILECINRIREDRVEQTTWRQSRLPCPQSVLGTLLMCHKGGASQHSPGGGTVLFSSLWAKLGCSELSFRYWVEFRVYSGPRYLIALWW